MSEQEKNGMQEENENPVPAGPKSSLVSIVGRPSAGKSTFLNTASGQQISIVSPVPQTTRNAIRGIINTAQGQIVFIDTPGLHASEKKLNLRLTKIAHDHIKESDSILYILDSTRAHGEEEAMIASLLEPFTDKLVIAINKTESAQSDAYRSRSFIKDHLPAMPPERIIEMSAKENTNVNAVLDALFALAEEGPHLYPEEFYTDQEVDFRIAEIIRGQAISRLEQELPHALYVAIDGMKMANENLLKVRAVLYVERESQKGIVIGKSASMVKAIRTSSEKECLDIFPYKVSIDLQVKVDKNWRQKDKVLGKLIR